MKKIVFLLLSFLLITGCSNKGKLIEITFEEYNKKIQNMEDFVLVIGKSDCNFCLNYKETLNKVFEEYDVTLYYIDVAKLSQEEKDRFLSRISFEDREIETPTTVYIQDGFEKSTYDRIIGKSSKTEVVKYLKKKGLINDGSK